MMDILKIILTSHRLANEYSDGANVTDILPKELHPNTNTFLLARIAFLLEALLDQSYKHDL